MSDDFDVVGRIKVDDDGNQTLERLNDNLDTSEEKVGGLGGAFSGLSSIVGGAVSVALGGIFTQALGSAVSAIGDFFNGALSAEVGLNKLNAAIDRQGESAAISKDGAQELAQSLKNLAGGSDDAVMAAETVLLKFKSIGKDVFPDATKASLDLAAVMGTDGATAAQVLGKALAVPGEGLARLKAVGVTFTDQQEKQIDAMVRAGDVAGAQKLILDALAETTGGAAAAAADTMSGRWAIFTESIADAGEGILMSFLPAAEKLFDQVIAPAIPLVTEIAAGVANLVSTVLSGGDPMNGVLAGLGMAIGNAFGPDVQNIVMAGVNLLLEVSGAITGIATALASGNLTGVFDALNGSLVNIGYTLGLSDEQIATLQQTMTNIQSWVVANWPVFKQTVADALTAVQVAAQPVIAAALNLWSAFQDSMPKIQAAVQTVMDFILQTWNTVFPSIQSTTSGTLTQISTLVTNILNGIATYWREHGDEVMARVTLIMNVVSAVIGGTLALVSGVINATLAVINGDWDGAGEALKTSTTAFMNAILSLVGTNLTEFTKTWSDNWEMLKTIVGTVTVNVLTAISNFLTDLSLKISQGILDAIAAAQGIVTGFSDVGKAMIDGMITGIQNAVSGLVSAATQAALDAFNAAKEALGIKSPSTLFAEIGRQTMAGFAGGINASSGLAAGAAASAAYSTVVSTINNLSLTVNSPLAPVIPDEFGRLGALAQAF